MYYSGKTLILKCQGNTPWVIISLILITSGVEYALLSQGEIRN